MTEKNYRHFFEAGDGVHLFVYEFQPVDTYEAIIFMICGIGGINHHSEKEIIALLADGKNRVIVMHPRGTGNSEGVRGDISTINLFISDYVDFIQKDNAYISKQYPVYLFGHSMACAVLLAVAEKLEYISGAILVNPPLIQKTARGMSPGIGQYIKYAFHMMFAKHKPVVNMAGNPAMIENEEDRKEARQRLEDKLPVKHFSMHYMNEVRKLLHAMPRYCIRATYPLLLIYGMKDAFVHKRGCDLIFENWKHPDKTYRLILEGVHGKATIKKAKTIITSWIKR
jgi:alpha-beta hydrolase superfamily lysophospholipase